MQRQTDRVSMEGTGATTTVQEKLKNLLKAHGIRATPQAITALLQAVRVSDSEYLGDSDTLLAGLLFSGSYTVDLLQIAGVDQTRLHQATLRSVSGSHVGHLPDEEMSAVLEGLFVHKSSAQELFDSLVRSQRRLETSEILRAALSPEPGKVLSKATFPFEDRKDSSPDSDFIAKLELSLAEAMMFVYGLGKGDNVSIDFRLRRRPLDADEDWVIDKTLGPYYPAMRTEELEFIVAAIDEWMVHRRVKTQPLSLCLETVGRLGSLLIAPTLFAESGGDLAQLEANLALARRFSPERDLPVVGLFLKQGRIYAGQFTYRGTTLVKADHGPPDPLVINVHAPAPLPLIPKETLIRFSRMLSRRDLSEAHIQSFLEANPEVLLSLGYARAHPHIVLRGENEEKSRLIPDFVMEIPGTSAFHILDLKTPTSRLLARSPYVRLSSELMKAVAQLRAYGEFFNSRSNRAAFEREHHLAALTPELIVIMGRAHQFRTREERRLIDSQMDPVRLITFDELLAFGATRSVDLPFPSLDPPCVPTLDETTRLV